jgi:prevent-host-death family protein
MKTIAAAEFKAKCLALIDRVHAEGESIAITKRGRTVARLVPAGDDERPWLRVRGTPRKCDEPFAPAPSTSVTSTPSPDGESATGHACMDLVD